ncbi:unnamed protein product [Pleuronectes platessa]|uniref:Uncharacterized protein n=1 Tax=Pleuronectes platessa TaxID=8262 RepID=A0A9N7Y5K5_PLEPL|nr:unnamed protein product [Pleuronectes platessa]
MAKEGRGRKRRGGQEGRRGRYRGEGGVVKLSAEERRSSGWWRRLVEEAGRYFPHFPCRDLPAPALGNKASSVSGLQRRTMEDPIFTISLKPLLFPESFTNSFCGRPLSLHFVFNIRKDSDDQELILTVVRRGQTSEGHRQDDAERTTLIYKFKSNCKVFRKMQSQHMIEHSEERAHNRTKVHGV